MLISELIVRHIRPEGALHELGMRLTPIQAPAGVRSFHHDEDHEDDEDDVDAAAPVAGDVLVVSAPLGLGLRERLDVDLPVGATVILLFEVEIPELPVGRVLAALDVAQLQVVEATAVSDTMTATVAVVAVRTDDLVIPQPYLAHDLEPVSGQDQAVLRRLLGEHALEGLVQRGRERLLMAQVGQGEARLREATTELEERRAVEREALVDESKALIRDLASARAERDAERKRLQAVTTSTTYKLVSRVARIKGLGRRIVRRPGHRKAST